MFRRTVVTALVLVVVVVPVAPAQAGTPRPTSMSALGDSITRGFNACGWFYDCTGRSWSSGSYSTVNSHYRRLTLAAPLVAYNDARTGAKAAALPGQSTTAVGRGAQYVTILIGANDACTRTVAEMTPVESFRASVSTAMATLASGGGRSVFVASIPDVHTLWQVGRSSASARAAWSAYGICQSMLANPTSTAQADVDRRAVVRARVMDFNEVLAAECVKVTTCVYDGGAAFGYQFSLSQLSTWDYFHPNTAGQAALARVTWPSVAARFGW